MLVETTNNQIRKAKDDEGRATNRDRKHTRRNLFVMHSHHPMRWEEIKRCWMLYCCSLSFAVWAARPSA